MTERKVFNLGTGVVELQHWKDGHWVVVGEEKFEHVSVPLEEPRKMSAKKVVFKTAEDSASDVEVVEVEVDTEDGLDLYLNDELVFAIESEGAFGEPPEIIIWLKDLKDLFPNHVLRVEE